MLLVLLLLFTLVSAASPPPTTPDAPSAQPKWGSPAWRIELGSDGTQAVGVLVDDRRGHLAPLGLQPGDRLLSVDGAPIRSREDLIAAHERWSGAEAVEILVLRLGQPVLLEGRIEAPVVPIIPPPKRPPGPVDREALAAAPPQFEQEMTATGIAWTLSPGALGAAGIASGDRLVSLDGLPDPTPQQVLRALARQDAVELEVERGNARRTVRVDLTGPAWPSVPEPSTRRPADEGGVGFEGGVVRLPAHLAPELDEGYRTTRPDGSVRLGTIRRDQPLHLAGFRTGDVVRRIAGRPAAEYAGFATALGADPVDFELDRRGEAVTLRLQLLGPDVPGPAPPEPRGGR